MVARKNAALAMALLGAAILLLAGCGAKTEDGTPSWQSVTQKEAVRMMEEETDYVILDVRTQEEYRTGHIPGAICVPNESIGDAEPPELPDKAQRIFVYCRSGNRSKKAAQKLCDLGYTGVIEFGGINTWTGEVVTE